MAVKPFNVMNLGKVGLFNPAELGYRDSLDIIKDESIKIQKSFVKIGWYLKHIKDNELYLEGGYTSINECAAEQFGYSQSTVSRFINICEKFSKEHNSPELDEKYAGFDKSQMIEMLPMEPEQLEKVVPEMTVKQIREIKNNGKEKTERYGEVEDTGETDIPGQTSLEEDFTEVMPDMTNSKPSGQEVEWNAMSYREPEEYEIDGSIEAGEALTANYTPAEEVSFLRKITQPDMPILKNMDQRKEWLGQYKEWGLWYRDTNIDVNYYKFDFKDGSRLIVAEYPQRQSYYSSEPNDECIYHLLEKNKKGYKQTYDEKYRHQSDSETYLVEFLKNLQRGG